MKIEGSILVIIEVNVDGIVVVIIEKMTEV